MKFQKKIFNLFKEIKGDIRKEYKIYSNYLIDKSPRKKPASQRKPQILSQKWLHDPIKSKYVLDEVGDLFFTCRLCQYKLACSSLYDHIDMHEKRVQNSNSDSSQPAITGFSMKNIQKQQFEFEITKFIVCNNLSFSIVDELMKLLSSVPITAVIYCSKTLQ